MNPIELYAMRFVEETGGSWTAEQLRAAEAEIEQQKREWEANRLAAIKKEEEDEKRAADEDEMLTYSREDAHNQVNNNKFSKRNPVNRRLLKVKQSDRHGISKNKRVKGRMTAKQPIRTVAQKTLGPRRALRNNSKPITSLAQNNSPTKKSQVAGTKRPNSVRVSSRLNKQPKRNDDANISSDDEPLIELNKNNGIAKNHSKLVKNDNDTTVGRSECSEERNSEDFDDSECSLDVMVDSTDPQESDEEMAADDDDDDNAEDVDNDNGNENESAFIQSDASVMSFDETDTDATKENSLNTSHRNNLDKNHPIDINSPRSTRSHGRIKINLWTLDESQNVAELCAKRSRHKAAGSKNTSFTSNSGGANENESCENGNGSSAEDINDDDAEDNDNNSTKAANTPEIKAMKQSKISDCFAKSSNDPVNENSRKKSLPIAKSMKIEKPIVVAKTPIGSSAKNHISHFDMNRTPKVVLNKHDCEIQQQKARLKSKT